MTGTGHRVKQEAKLRKELRTGNGEYYWEMILMEIKICCGMK